MGLLFDNKLRPLLLAGMSLTTFNCFAIDIQKTYFYSIHNSRSLRAAKELSMAASDETYQAIAAWLPQVSLEGYGFRGDYQLDGNGTQFNDDGLDVSGTQMIFDFSALESVFSRKFIKSLAQIKYQISEQNTIKKALDSYMGVLMGRRLLNLATLYQKTVKTAVYQAKMAHKLKLKLQDTVDYAESDYQSAIADTIQAQTFYSDAVSALERITNEHIKEIIPLSYDSIFKLPAPPSLAVWENRAMKRNLALKAMRMATEIARRKVNIARGKRLPTIEAKGSYSLMQNKGFYSYNGQLIGATNFNGTNHIHGYNIGLVASVPLFTGGSITSEINQNEHLYRELQYKTESLQYDLRLKTRTDYLLLKSDLAKVKAIKKAIAANKDALRIEKLQMKAHKKTLLDVMETQTKLAKSQQQYEKAVYDYFQRYISLHEDAGELNKYVIVELNLYLDQQHPIKITQ